MKTTACKSVNVVNRYTHNLKKFVLDDDQECNQAGVVLCNETECLKIKN